MSSREMMQLPEPAAIGRLYWDGKRWNRDGAEPKYPPRDGAFMIEALGNERKRVDQLIKDRRQRERILRAEGQDTWPEPIYEVPPERKAALSILKGDSALLCLKKMMALRLEQMFGRDDSCVISAPYKRLLKNRTVAGPELPDEIEREVIGAMRQKLSSRAAIKYFMQCCSEERRRKASSSGAMPRPKATTQKVIDAFRDVAEQEKVDHLVEIDHDTPQWKAWSAYYRGTKTESRMLECLANGRPFYVAESYPPDAPRADRVRPSAAEPPAPAEHRTPADGEVDVVAARLTAKTERDDVETAEEKKRRKSYGDEQRSKADMLAAARENRRIDVSDNVPWSKVRIEDPDEAVDLIKVGRGAPMAIAKAAPQRERVVSANYRNLGADQKKAVEVFQARYDGARVGGLRAMDPATEKVDGGLGSGPDMAMMVAAAKDLEEFEGVLGVEGYELLCLVIGEGWQLKEVMKKWNVPDKEKNYRALSWHFHQALDTLAAYLGFKTVPWVKRGLRPAPTAVERAARRA